MNVPKSSLESSHFPVMLNEVIKICSPDQGGNYIDCTFGGGSYTKALLKFPNTKVIAIDRDKFVLQKVKKIKDKYLNRFSFFNERFSNLDKVIKSDFKADAIIFDLGLSSFQLTDMSRGFSFKSKDKIDMNMGLSSISAEEILNNCDVENLKMIIRVFGDEKEASKIARNIVKARKIKKISKVYELVQIIEKSKRKNYKKKINVCTKTFQALRIFVNKEINEIFEGVIKATKFVKKGGKIIIISFHSIEDKIIKFYFSNYSNNRSQPSRYLPLQKEKQNILFEEYKNNLIKPSDQEIKLNNPSRSAKLRFAVRNDKEFRYPDSFKYKFQKLLELESRSVT
jgi:16S rRNA (cytosine1402-N4)-methyltransferase